MSNKTAPPIRQTIAFLPVKDLARSLAFYHAHFALAPAYRRPSVAILEVRPESFLGLVEKPDRVEGDKTFTFSFVVDNVAPWFDKLTTAGAVIKGPPIFKEEFGINIIYVPDPDGHTIEVLEMRDAGWPRSA